MNFKIFTSAKVLCGSIIAQIILVYHRKNNCGYNLLNKFYTYNHNHCRKHWKFVKLGIQHNRKYQVQNCEIFSPIITQNWHFLKCHGYCSTNKYKLLLHKNIKAATDCSYIYCEGNCNKVLQTHAFFLQTHIHWCYKSNWQHCTKYKPNKFSTKYYYNKNIKQWLVLLIWKVVFQSISSTYHLYQTQESILQWYAKYQTTFSCLMERTHS